MFSSKSRRAPVRLWADVGIGPYIGLRPQAHAANFLRTDTAITNNDGVFRQ